jgi:hypothetical protein
MRHSSSTVVVLSGAVPDQVLAAIGRSMNVALVRPKDDEDAAAALVRAGRAGSRYALVPADPLADLAKSWQAMWDVTRQEGPDGFELEAAKAVAAWRAGQFELPDYYLALTAAATENSGPDFHLGPLRSVRSHRVAAVPATEPAQQAAEVLHALGTLSAGPWWPGLDDIIETARGFYPGTLVEKSQTAIGANLSGPASR